jgi:hypothetical protein
MLSSGANVIIWDEMLSSGDAMLSSGANVIIWDEMLSSGDAMLSSVAHVIIWDKMLSSGMLCYHLKLMLSSERKYYHLG